MTTEIYVKFQMNTFGGSLKVIHSSMQKIISAFAGVTGAIFVCHT